MNPPGDLIESGMTRPSAILPAIFLLLPLPVSVPAAEVEVTNLRRAFHNGEHNAFTDLIRWKGKFWLTFRSCPDGHMVFPSSSIRILSSEDAREWKEEHRFSVKHRDVRDPHFLLFNEQLFVYTGTWWSGEGELPREQYDLNKHLGYAVFTGDGENWSAPTQLEGTYGHYIWRAAAYDGKAYLCGRRKTQYEDQSEISDTNPRAVESALLQSDDGLTWKFHSLFQPERGNETAFFFEKDGALLAVSRDDSESSELIRAAPPWREKARLSIPEFIGGPLLARWGDDTLVGGRRNTDDGPKSVLYWLNGDALTPFAELPSGGDNSYPGFVELEDGSGLVSWYSSHEKDGNGKTITAIYLAELVRKKN